MPAAAVKARIARTLVHAPNDSAARLGSVTLQRHQLEGVARIRAILMRRRGALLADEVGLGKTYTALGVARHFARVEIVAPAALRAMWHEACDRCEVSVNYVSAESLSRSPPAEGQPELILVDEAHWFRNPATKRYRRLAQRCRATSVLLLSATPVHNRPEDLSALFALFLGARAARLAPNEIADLTVRRRRQRIVDDLSPAPPGVQPTRWWRVRCNSRVIQALEVIEAPVPPRDGGLALALLRLTLVRRLSSSDAALRITLRRMLARALALLDAVRGGRYPTARELCAWIVADEAIQLALPGLMGSGNSDANESVSLEAIERHAASVRAALAALHASRDHDRLRASILQRLMRRFPDARIVAFSQYDATVRALARALRHVQGVAALSGKGGRIASGRIARGALLQQFDATNQRTVHAAMHVRLLLTTDLLSEGVNLHNARVVVHLDIPWTPARLEQRVGRLSRIGSPHREIHVFGFAPPHALEQLQRTVSRLRAKWSAARRRFGESALLAHDALLTSQRLGMEANSYALDQEALLELMTSWLGSDDTHSSAPGPTPLVACVRVDGQRMPMALALVQSPGGHRLVAFEGKGAVKSHPRVVLQVARQLTAAEDVRAPQMSGMIRRTVRRFERYLTRARGTEAAVGDLGASTAALHGRIAHAIASLPRTIRPRALHLASAIRAALLRARSAGDLAVLDESCERLLACAAASPPLRWLEDTHSELVTCLGGHAHGQLEQPDAYRVVGTLIGI